MLKGKFSLSMPLIMMALLQKEATPVTLLFMRGYIINFSLLPFFHTFQSCECLSSLIIVGSKMISQYYFFLISNIEYNRYCYKIPVDYPLDSAAPLLCAGITVYAPMIRHNMNQPGKSLGVIGLGGLGHMAVKFGKAFGLNVTVFSTSISKKEEALNLLGANNFVISTDHDQMKVERRVLFIL